MGRTQSTQEVREDFDRIAGLSGGEGWDHNAHYHPFLLRQLPPRLHEALEVGCGTGAFARSLAERSGRVLAIDLSPRMIEVAQDRSKGHPNIEYAVADANSSWPFPKARFDCVASITTAHHLPLAPILRKMGDALRPGGTLLVLGLYRVRTVADYLVGAAGFPASKVIRLAKTGAMSGPRQPPELRRVWDEHYASDRFPTLAEVREACAEAGLRGARVRRHLLWRYSLVWRKPIRWERPPAGGGMTRAYASHRLRARCVGPAVRPRPFGKVCLLRSSGDKDPPESKG